MQQGTLYVLQCHSLCYYTHTHQHAMTLSEATPKGILNWICFFYYDYIFKKEIIKLTRPMTILTIIILLWVCNDIHKGVSL